MSTENKTATEQAMLDRPTSFEEWAARTPEAMRREMSEMAHYGRSWQEHRLLEHCSPLVRQVFMHADRIGLSGEDRYTVLAYMALRSLASAQDHLFQSISLQPRQTVIPRGGAEVGPEGDNQKR